MSSLITGVLEAKRALQFATAGTFRGGLITPTQRAVVEEAIVRFMVIVGTALVCRPIEITLLCLFT